MDYKEILCKIHLQKRHFTHTKRPINRQTENVFNPQEICDAPKHGSNKCDNNGKQKKVSSTQKCGRR